MIKKLSLKNIDEVAALFFSVFTKEPWFDKWDTIESTKPYIIELMKGENTLSYGYYISNQLIALSLGYVFSFYKGKEYFIKEFCVDDTYQHQGIGTKFIEAIEENSKATHIRAIWLNTEKDMVAYDFYLKQKFNVSYNTVLMYKEIK